MNIACSRGLYAITDGTHLTAAELLKKSAQILSCGIALFQYRDKHALKARKKELACALKTLCEQYQTPFIVNDDLELAKAVAADGLHLGQTDIDIGMARAELGDKIIGISCYGDLNRAIWAESNSADYVAFGACYPSSTKPDASIVTLATLAQAKSTLTIPIVAIGGITPENGQDLVAAKVDYLAVISGLFAAKDTLDQTTQYLSLFK